MTLKRTLTLPFVTFYGLGTIIGAGIYALIGKVIQHAQQYATLSFLIAAGVALFTAASYAELCSRFPQSAGSSLYIRKAFNLAWLSGMVGWLVVTTGVISAATLANAFVEYLHIFFHTSSLWVIPLLIIILGSIAMWGITESAATILIMTCLEILGLLIIIYYGKNNLNFSFNWHTVFPSFHSPLWSSILLGSFIGFYAFIGFEDMVNISEETKNPQRVVPLAIFLALGGAVILYLLVTFVTVWSLPREILLRSDIPLIAIIKHQGHSPIFFGLIALVAIMNGIIVQIIMGSRLIYGMSKQNNAPAIFEKVHQKTQTPLLATLLVQMLIIIFAVFLPIELLAKLTSTVMLCVYSLMHFVLIVIKFKYPESAGTIVFPIIIPIIGLILSLTFLIVSWVLAV